jgi:hypothetical protein
VVKPTDYRGMSDMALSEAPCMIGPHCRTTTRFVFFVERSRRLDRGNPTAVMRAHVAGRDLGPDDPMVRRMPRRRAHHIFAR